ncbi:MAG: flagellar biosynthesis anti-sigma factor FlgM [Clostridiales bacterium]|nr:flagellar biosynthesis anti-sigma factor FlgM [Clostridiales bacterium]
MPRIAQTGASPVTRMAAAHWARPAAPGTGKAEDRGRYDQTTFSRVLESTESHVMELTGRVSQQLRARHTAGELAELGQQVRQGTYQPDPAAIAARLLLLPQGGNDRGI